MFKKITNFLKRCTPTLVGVSVLLLAGQAHAATGGGGLPWEAPLTTLANSFTGPVPYAISLLGIVVSGSMVIFGGELGYFVRGLLVLVLVIAMIIAAKNFMSGLGLGAGAVVGVPHPAAIHGLALKR
jgi:type IV secretory pathway VirB2 component (pilin)